MKKLPTFLLLSILLCAGCSSGPAQTSAKFSVQRSLQALNAALDGAPSDGADILVKVDWLDDGQLITRVASDRIDCWSRHEPSLNETTELVCSDAIFSALNTDDTDADQILAENFTDSVMAFDFRQQRWSCELGDQPVCRAVGDVSDRERPWPQGAFLVGRQGPADSASPNGRFLARRAGPNLEIIDTGTDRVAIQTTDGSAALSYANTLPTSWSGRVQVATGDLDPPTEGRWSPDSRYFLTMQTDESAQRMGALLRSQPPGGRDQPPDVLRYRQPLPSDETPVQMRLVVADVQSGVISPLNMSWVNAPIDPFLMRFVQWKDDSNKEFFFLTHTRGSRIITLWEGNARTRRVKEVFSETSSTRAGVTGSLIQYGVEDIPGSSDYLWYSDRDGRGAIYRLDGARGQLGARLTAGNVTVSSIRHIDVEAGTFLFTGFPAASVTDPDRQQLYRSSLRKTDQVRLTSLDTHHEIFMSPSGNTFVDEASLIDTPPRVTLRNTDDGVSVMRLLDNEQKRMASTLRVERFEVLAADGKTPLFGNLYVPSWAKKGDTFPVIDWVYGSAEYAVAQEGYADRSRVFWPLAEAGFVVFELDARGTPGRTKAFNDFGIGAGHNNCAVDDHAAAITQLADRGKFIDPSRVGVGGWSGGGQCAYRFALGRPDVFKAAVVGAPSVDPYIIGPLYIEDFLGLYTEVPKLFEEGADDPRLTDYDGDWLIIQGELDDDVHPANALRLVDQLIKADLVFEFLYLPGKGHAAIDDYVIKRMADFYARTLWGERLFDNKLKANNPNK